MGSIFRLADGLRIKELILCGYTPKPPHPKLEATARQTEHFVLWRHFETSLQAVLQLKSEGWSVWGAEPVKNAKNALTSQFSPKTAFIFGNEALGIQPETLRKCDSLIQLPLLGFKNSINVANSAAAIGYLYLQQISNEKR